MNVTGGNQLYLGIGAFGSMAGSTKCCATGTCNKFSEVPIISSIIEDLRNYLNPNAISSRYGSLI